MGNKAREYKESDVRRLCLFSGNQCARPTCNKSLMGFDKKTMISKICHIEGASAGGPRYNPNMTDDERRHYKNLILLCDECHSVVDNKENKKLYPVSLLQEWKTDHQEKMMVKLSRNPSLLKEAIRAISKLTFNEESIKNSENEKPFLIEEKLSYNSISRNRFLFEEYKIFQGKINTLYEELETQGSFSKENLLRYIKHLYLTTKGRYVTEKKYTQEQIRQNSDNIIEDIQENLYKSITEDSASNKEDIEFGISIIIVDAFMRCKILEKPQ